MFPIALVVVFVATVGGGSWGHHRFGLLGWSPMGLVLALFAILYFTDNLDLR